MSRSTWERVELGSAAVTLGTLCAMTAAVGLDIVIRAYPGASTSLRDRGQISIASSLADAAHPSWRTSLEVTAGDHGQAIDQVFCLMNRHVESTQSSPVMNITAQPHTQPGACCTAPLQSSLDPRTPVHPDTTTMEDGLTC